MAGIDRWLHYTVTIIDRFHYISQIYVFYDFCVFIFADGHVLPLHKSRI